MAEKRKHSLGLPPTADLLAELPRIELQASHQSKQLREIPFEAGLANLADLSIERETEMLRELLEALGKL